MSQQKVLGHGKIGGVVQFLVNHADPELFGLTRPVDTDQFTIEINGPAVPLIVAI